MGDPQQTLLAVRQGRPYAGECIEGEIRSRPAEPATLFNSEGNQFELICLPVGAQCKEGVISAIARDSPRGCNMRVTDFGCVNMGNAATLPLHNLLTWSGV